MFSSSPTIVLPPSQPDQYFANSHYASTNGQTPSTFGNPFTPSASIPPTPGSVAGRKRSRGDIFSPDDDEIQPDGSLPTPESEAPTESQSYPWTEEQAARKPFQLSHVKRPSASSRKSQRLDATASGPDDLAQLVLPASMREATREPLIDEATRVLGISWTRMDSSEALRINQAAYKKFIQNHYPAIKDVTVWFENSAIPGYLVLGSNAHTGEKEYYIFSHDLTEGRLITREPSDLLPRLKMLPALHLAAPGGCIRAQTDAVTAVYVEAQQEIFRGRVQDQPNPQGTGMELQPEGVCAAHAMELD